MSWIDSVAKEKAREVSWGWDLASIEEFLLEE